VARQEINSKAREKKSQGKKKNELPRELLRLVACIENA